MEPIDYSRGRNNANSKHSFSLIKGKVESQRMQVLNNIDGLKSTIEIANEMGVSIHQISGRFSELKANLNNSNQYKANRKIALRGLQKKHQLIIKMENRTNLYKAIIAVMKTVKNIEKSMTVGAGTNSYKGVADKDVKFHIGKAMEEQGLAMIPIEVNPKLSIERWEETNQYGTKNKQQIFTEVTTKYLLIHESGESIEVVGYGHGIDTQDKAAGKATTYALKYTLLYTFMVPTGEILDTDKDHSDTIEIPPPAKTVVNTENKLKILKYGSKMWDQLTERVSKGEIITKEDLKKFFVITEVEKELESLNIF